MFEVTKLDEELAMNSVILTKIEASCIDTHDRLLYTFEKDPQILFHRHNKCFLSFTCKGQTPFLIGHVQIIRHNSR